MRICFVGTGSLKEYRKAYDNEEVDLVLLGFSGIGEVSYEKELKGESDYFEDGALLSKESGATVVCGCVTDTRGQKRRSALVAENGKLAGVSDALYALDGEYACGADLRVYETKTGKLGVVVAEDLYFPEAIRSLALCGSDFIVCPFGKVQGELPSVLLRAHAFEYGVPILLCGKGYSMIATPKGEIAFSSPNSPVFVDYACKKEYHLLHRRRSGCFRVEY